MPIHSTESYWILETQATGYAFGLNETGLLTHCYWGQRLTQPADYPAPVNPWGWASFNSVAQVTPEEYPGYGGAKYIEPCLKVTFADGVRDVVLQFDSAEVTDNVLLIHLKDAHYPLNVTLHYRVHEQHDLIERWVSVQNTGAENIVIERIWSAQWHLPRGDHYWLKHLSGRWLDEFHIQHEPLKPGVKVLESRRITTSHHHNPCFALDNGTATEDSGDIWFGTLAWSGNWKIAAEVTDFLSTRVNIGLNDFDFAWVLHPNDTFITPASFGGFTPDGFGEASRKLHNYIRAAVLPRGDTIRKILYNSWEATTFSVDEQSQIELAKVAANLGIELFVMDDGWFQGRNDDHAGLGDWWPDAAKFPNGLKPLVDAVNALGMDFGLWVEPEMVNPNSDLYRAHPEWAIHFPTRDRTEMRNQLILNMGRADVQDYLIAHIDKLLSENNIAFIKWDMNRNVSEPGWPDAPADARELWVRYVHGVYRVWQTLKDRHPNVIWQSCSGGGGRADMGILRLADQIWVSDNTEATARLSIQEGFSQVFPANTMEAWVTEGWRGATPAPLKFRFHVSMCGTLGIGSHLLHWTDAERAEAGQLIADYKMTRHIVQLGDMFRLRSPQQHPVSAVQYVSKDKSEAVVFIFRTFLPEPAQLPALYLKGLDETAIYENPATGERKSGAGWMYAGLPILLGNLQSTMLHLKRV